MNPLPRATGGGIPGPVDIARALVEDGRFEVTMPPLPTQRLVDLQWAAYEAGRLISMRVRVSVDGPEFRWSPDVTVTVVPLQLDRWQRAMQSWPITQR